MTREEELGLRFDENGGITYDTEARKKLIEEVILDIGYERAESGENEWFKIYDREEDYSPVMVIDADLNATLEFNDISIFSRFVDDEGGSEAEDLIDLIREADKQVIEDSYKVEEHINQVLTETRKAHGSKRDGKYIVETSYEDFGSYDEDGLFPTVYQDFEFDTEEELVKALNEEDKFCISEVENIYFGFDEVTKNYLEFVNGEGFKLIDKWCEQL